MRNASLPSVDGFAIPFGRDSRMDAEHVERTEELLLRILPRSSDLRALVRSHLPDLRHDLPGDGASPRVLARTIAGRLPALGIGRHEVAARLHRFCGGHAEEICDALGVVRG